jgi:hypothetical protein
MQHYGLPTRLLDWTRSPLAALYFALEHEKPVSACDAAVWLLFPGHLNKCAPQGTPSIPLLNSPYLRPLVKQAFNRDASPKSNTVFATRGTKVDIRMAVQQGSFTIHGDNSPLENHTAAQTALVKFTIPADSKENLRREVRLLGMRRSNLFPDLTNLAIDIATDRLLRVPQQPAMITPSDRTE